MSGWSRRYQGRLGGTRPDRSCARLLRRGVSWPKVATMKRAWPVLPLLVLLVVLDQPVVANDGRDGYHKVREQSFSAQDFNYFAIGTIIDWTDGRTQVRIDFRVDTFDGSTASASEWGIEVYDTACGARRAYALYAAQAVDDPTYGVRLHEFLSPHLLRRAGRGSVVVVHDGPTPTRHAADSGYSGRHELACVDLAR